MSGLIKRAFTLDGSTARWPARLNDTEVKIPTIDPGASLDDQIKALKSLLPEGQASEALGDFLTTAVYNKLLNQVDNYLKGKDSDGKQRSATISKADLQAYCEKLLLEPSQRKQGQSPKARLERTERKLEASAQALVDAVKLISDKKARQKAFDQYKADGLIPSDATL